MNSQEKEKGLGIKLLNKIRRKIVQSRRLKEIRKSLIKNKLLRKSREN